MRNKLTSSILAGTLVLALVVPTFAQSTDITTPQDDSAANSIFLPLVTNATQIVSEAELTPAIGAEVQAAAVIATNGKIAFSSTMDGDADIYTMNPDGSGLVNLTNSLPGPHQTEPAWSPDGTKLAFVMGAMLNSAGVTTGFIQVMNADGTNPVYLTLSNTGGGTDYQPEWSPDGTKIAFTTRREGDFDIYIMNADGTNLHNIFVSEPINSGQPGEADPSWSPDGSKLLYIQTNSLLAKNIVVLDAAGVGPQQLIAAGLGVEFADPEWSPDGKLIAYMRLGSAPELWVMNADGTNRTQLTVSNVVNSQAPDFSADGKLLTVIGQPAGVAGATKELFALPAPAAPLAAPATLTVAATRMTTAGGVSSADWQRTLVTTQRLTVTVSGSGVVTSQPLGINCGTQCTAEFTAGSKVTLTATAGKGAKFGNWSGACTTKVTTCTVTMTQARSVVANFKKK